MEMRKILFQLVVIPLFSGLNRAMQRGKPKVSPHLLSVTPMPPIWTRYRELVRFWDLARNGNLLGMHGVTDADFVSRLESMATKLRRIIPTLRGLDKQVVERKFSNILSIINDHSISKMAAGYRRAPFAIEFLVLVARGKHFVRSKSPRLCLPRLVLTIPKARSSCLILQRSIGMELDRILTTSLLMIMVT